MKNFLRIATGVPTLDLLLAIQRLEKSHGVWQADTYLRDYPQGPFANTESIILRFPPRSVHETEVALATHNANFDPHENVDQPVYKTLSEARPLVMNLMAAVQGERLGRVMINKLIPGGSVYPHADTPLHAEYWDRFHICLQSGPGASFRCGSEYAPISPGEVWWFNNRLEHEAVNNSDDDRIHLVLDIRTSKPC